MKITYKGVEIDYNEGSACIMQPTFKGFASDEIKNGKCALEKAKEYIDKLEIKSVTK